jgi:hypothetical protein|tara:strand:- start:1309 stop:1596 length:288 start_codon:yes stop_codon:yes gene_type:complete
MSNNRFWYYVKDNATDSFLVIEKPEFGSATVIASGIPNWALAQQISALPDMMLLCKAIKDHSIGADEEEALIDRILTKVEVSPEPQTKKHYVPKF